MGIQNLQTVRLDVNNNYEIDVTCKQLDNVILTVVVYDKSLPADLSNYNVRLKAIKSDQKILIQNTNITVNNNLVIIKADSQLTAAGSAKAELQFINKTTLEKKSTFYINIEVASSVFDEASVSTNVCTLLKELDTKLDQIENIGEILDEAIEENAELKTNTASATTINNTLKESISNAKTSKDALDLSKTNADKSNTDLKTSIGNAKTSKGELDNSKTSADASKVELDKSIAVSEKFIQDHQDIENVVQNKIELFIGETLPDVNVRKENTLYFKVIDTISSGNGITDTVKVSPIMGIKLV